MAWGRNDRRWIFVGVHEPRIGQWLVDHPVRTPLLVGLGAGAFATTDRPLDWPFVAGMTVVVGGAVSLSGVIVRKRVRREEFDPTAQPVSEPHSNVTPRSLDTK